MKIVSSTLLIILFAAAAFAQTSGTVSGKVADANNAGISRSHVTLTSKSASNITFTAEADTAGNYHFNNVPAGTYLLTADNGELSGSAQGTEEVIVTGGLGSTVNITVQPVVSAQVTISSGTAKPVDEIAKSVSIIDGEEIENRNEQTVIDTLRTVPGFRVQQLGGFGRLATIKTRGLRNQDTAILLDGQRFRDVTAITGDASSFLGDLMSTDVGRVEVLRGSGSSLYGTNAIGGVVNVLSNDFSNDPRGDALVEGGSLGLIRGRAGFSAGYKNKAFFNAAISHNNYKDGVDGNDVARNTSGKAGFQYRFGNFGRLTSRFYASDGFAQLNLGPDTSPTLGPITAIINAVPLSDAELARYENGTPISSLNFGSANFIPDGDDPDFYQKTRFYNFQLAYDGTINKYATYRVSYQDLTTRRRNVDGPAGPGFFQPFGGSQRSDFEGNVQTFQAKSNITAQSNLITIGYGFEREKFGNDNFGVNNVGNNSTNATQSSNTFVVQDQLAAFDRRLQLSGAFRVQLFDLGTPVFSSTNPPYQNLTLDNPATSYTFDGSAAWFFRSTGTKLRAHGGNGYRVPSLYERYGTFYDTFSVPNVFQALGDPRLKPERSFGIDGGIDQSLGKDRVRLSATYFYTKLIDTIGFGNVVPPIGTTPRFFGGYLNQKGGISRGAEFSAEFKPHSTTRIFTSYTFTTSLQRDPQVTGSNILRTLGVPEHQFTLVFDQRIANCVNVNFDFVATSSYLAPIFSNSIFATRIYSFEGNHKGDVTVSYDLPKFSEKVRLKFFGTVENIFNQEYYENGFRTAKATAHGGLKVSF